MIGDGADQTGRREQQQVELRVSAGLKNWSQTTTCNTRLLVDLAESRDAEAFDAAWRRVDQRYGPLVEAFGRRMGLDPELARDARQEAMLAFSEKVRHGGLDRSRGRPRDLLFGIAKYKVIDMLKQHARQPRQVAMAVDETDFFDRLPDGNQLEKEWDRQWALAVRAQCLREAQVHFNYDTYLMYYMKAIEGLPSAEVAKIAGKTGGAVNMATFHVKRFLRQILPAIERSF
jgi:DNA-directed RNA polymerase specialized sigma24 family protein